MKKRVISAIIALLIVIPVLIIGGYPYKIAVTIIGIIGFYEVLSAKEKEKKLPTYVKIASYLCFIALLIINFTSNALLLNINISYIVAIMLMLILPIVIYHDNDKYNIKDASYLLMFILFLGLSFGMLINIREYNVYYLLLILIISISSDTFAYITGMLIGKNKLCESISPKKTIEGFFGSVIFATFAGTTLYVSIFEYTGSLLPVILIVFIISLMSTIGDLIFSSVKREYKIKDFGKIMPGHGGVLDRSDSILFALMMMYLIMGLM